MNENYKKHSAYIIRDIVLENYSQCHCCLISKVPYHHRFITPKAAHNAKKTHTQTTVIIQVEPKNIKR